MLHLPVFFKFQDTQVEPSLKQAFNAAHFSYPYFVVRLLLLFLLFSSIKETDSAPSTSR